jgi:hypothetical protein
MDSGSRTARRKTTRTSRYPALAMIASPRFRMIVSTHEHQLAL